MPAVQLLPYGRVLAWDTTAALACDGAGQRAAPEQFVQQLGGQGGRAWVASSANSCSRISAKPAAAGVTVPVASTTAAVSSMQAAGCRRSHSCSTAPQLRQQPQQSAAHRASIHKHKGCPCHSASRPLPVQCAAEVLWEGWRHQQHTLRRGLTPRQRHGQAACEPHPSLKGARQAVDAHSSSMREQSAPTFLQGTPGMVPR